MRVVLDTNVVVSAAMTSGGNCARILDMLMEGLFGLCVDDRILAEYDSVLHRTQLRIAPEDAAIIMEWMRSTAEPVTAAPLDVQLPDPYDTPFLEVAAACGAILITGNARHYPKASRAGVTVLTPSEFVETVRRSS